MPRLPTNILSRRVLPSTRTTLNPTGTLRTFSWTDISGKGAQNSRPGWEGRQGDPNHKLGDDHAVNRDGLDAQSKESQAGLKGREDAEKGNHDSSHGQGVSRKDENNSAQKAKEEFPEAPGPIIGMNSERGSVSVVPCCLSAFLVADELTFSAERESVRHLRGWTGRVPAYHCVSAGCF